MTILDRENKGGELILYAIWFIDHFDMVVFFISPFWHFPAKNQNVWCIFNRSLQFLGMMFCATREWSGVEWMNGRSAFHSHMKCLFEFLQLVHGKIECKIIKEIWRRCNHKIIYIQMEWFFCWLVWCNGYLVGLLYR